MNEKMSMEQVLKYATDVLCPKCSSNTFETVIIIKKISALLSPSGEESILTLPAYRCTECHYILEPGDMDNNKKEDKKLTILK